MVVENFSQRKGIYLPEMFCDALIGGGEGRVKRLSEHAREHSLEPDR